MFEAPSQQDESEFTDSMKIEGVHLDVEWHVDVDSIQIDCVCVSDSAGDDISALLSPATEAKIKRELRSRLDAMERETKAWRGQYNSVD